MPVDLTPTLDRVTAKARLLVEKYHRLEAQKAAADARVASLEEQTAALSRRLEQLEAHLEYMTVATTIIPSRADLQASRTMVADLVREIDRCITDLTQ